MKPLALLLNGHLLMSGMSELALPLALVEPVSDAEEALLSGRGLKVTHAPDFPVAHR